MSTPRGSRRSRPGPRRRGTPGPPRDRTASPRTRAPRQVHGGPATRRSTACGRSWRRRRRRPTGSSHRTESARARGRSDSRCRPTARGGRGRTEAPGEELRTAGSAALRERMPRTWIRSRSSSGPALWSTAPSRLSLPTSCSWPPSRSASSRESFHPSRRAITSAIALTRAEWPRVKGSLASMACDSAVSTTRAWFKTVLRIPPPVRVAVPKEIAPGSAVWRSSPRSSRSSPRAGSTSRSSRAPARRRPSRTRSTARRGRRWSGSASSSPVRRAS